jgi:hypothetical protein
MNRSGCRAIQAAAVLVLALTVTLVGVAGAANKPKVHLTAAGKAAARKAVVRKSDLGGGIGWKGGMRKPDLSPDNALCSSFHPKVSDLVVIGAARSEWTNVGLVIESDSEVLRTPRMVRLDWKRTVLSPHLKTCLRSVVKKGLGSKGQLVSLRRFSVPRIKGRIRGYGFIIKVQAAGTKVSMMFDTILIGRGRTEVTLMTAAPLASKSAVRKAERALVARLVKRIKA